MEEYGTDALRFTLVYLAPMGVDVYFSKDSCEIGRNFANKIWNAFRFLQLKRSQISDNGSVQRAADYKQDLFDIWIDSRLNSTIKAYFSSLDDYRINEVSKALYDFIWKDFCDWYIELIKIKTSEESEFAAIVLDDAFAIFEKVLKLLHPVMPFITEELWHSINERKENDSICISDFPVVEPDKIDEEIENEVIILQELVTALRNLRSELNLAPSVKCDVIINCPNAKAKKQVTELSHYIISLARIENLEITLTEELKKLAKFKSITSVTNNYQIYIKVEGLIDIDQEKARLEKEIKRTESFLESLNKKLRNENFLKKASEDVVESEKKKQQDFSMKLQKLREHLHELAE